MQIDLKKKLSKKKIQLVVEETPREEFEQEQIAMNAKMEMNAQVQPEVKKIATKRQSIDMEEFNSLDELIKKGESTDEIE